jgi:two-component system chemotaxis response regulator CheB
MDEHQLNTSGIEMVVIGASAGGVEALGILLRSLPPRFSAALAIVLHIPPDRSSLLPELFAPRCALRIKEVEDKEPVQSNTVYFAAPDYHMLIEPDKSFSLSRDEQVNYSRPSIDLLFESAASTYGQNLLGIVLTGSSADGAEGLKTIRAHGGSAWVQDPTDAKSHLMPASAIELAGADHVYTLDVMAKHLSCLTTTSTDWKPRP